MSPPPTVHFQDFAAAEDQSEISAIQRVLRSGRLVLGDEVRDFEVKWAARCGVSDAVGVANGLDAIEIGLRALKIGPGDEVITSPMTAVATVLGILRAGATPVLADIRPDTALLDIDSVERSLSPRTRAVLLVHLYGHLHNMAAWSAFCEAHDVFLLEDCAQAHDAQEEGKKAGSWGAFGAYSFYPTKNLGAVGDAGALVTSISDVAVAARSLRNYGQSNRYEHPLQGLNSRLDEVQAAVLAVRLRNLEARTQRRREIASIYRSNITNEAVRILANSKQPTSHVNHLFVVTTQDRDGLQRHLASVGIETLIHYPIPVHQQESLRDLPRDPTGLRVSENHASQCLSLPCAPHLTNDQVSQVVSAVNDFSP